MTVSGKGPLPIPEPLSQVSQLLPVCTCVCVCVPVTFLGPLLVPHGCGFDFYLDNGRCRGGQDLRGRAQFTKATTFPAPRGGGHYQPTWRSPVPTQGWVEPRLLTLFCDQSWEGCRLLLVPLWEQPKQASPGPVGSPAGTQDCSRVPRPGRQACVRVRCPSRSPGAPTPASRPCPRLVQLAGGLTHGRAYLKSCFFSSFLWPEKWWQSLTLRNTEESKEVICNFSDSSAFCP